MTPQLREMLEAIELANSEAGVEQRHLLDERGDAFCLTDDPTDDDAAPLCLRCAAVGLEVERMQREWDNPA